MPEATVTIDGTQHKVDLASIKLPDGHKVLSDDALRTSYVERSKVDSDYVLKETVEDTIQKRFKNHVHKDEAAKDPGVVQAVLAANKGKDIDIEATKKTWQTEELDPVAKQRDSLLRRAKGAAINEAARAAGIAEQFVKSPSPGKGSYMELTYGDSLEYDDALGDFVVVNSDGHRLGALDPEKSGRRHMNAEDFFTREAKLDSFKPFLEPEKKQDAGTHYGRPRPGDKPPESKGKGFFEKSREERAAGYVAEANQSS